MHLVTGKRRAVGGRTAHRLQAFLCRQRRYDVEQSKAFDRCRWTFNSIRVGDAASEHLVAAAKAENHSAAPPMRGNVDIEAGCAQCRQISDRRLRARQDNEICVARKCRAGTNPHEIDLRLGIERIEIVEIGDVRQDRDDDAHPRSGFRRPVLLKRQRILRWQRAGSGKVRHEAEGFPSGRLSDPLHARSKQRRIATKFVDDKPTDQRRILRRENRLGPDNARDHATAVNVTNEDDGDFGGAGKSHIGDIVRPQVHF